MSGVLAVTVSESSALVWNAPSADRVATLMLGIPQVLSGGGWIGPRPRIVREARAGSATAGFVTHATWLFTDPNPRKNILEIDYRRDLTLALHAALEGNGDWSIPLVVPYAAAVNGSLPWWQSGNAAVTRTANGFPEGAERLSQAESPVGPTTDASALAPILGTVGDWSKLLLVGGLVVGGVLFLPELVAAVGFARAARGRR